MGQFLNSREPYDKYRTVILELKVDHTPEEAIAQIKEKEYALRFKGKMAERNDIPGVYWRLESVMIKKQKNMPVK